MAGILLVALILLMIGSNEALGYYFSHCETDEPLNCLLQSLGEEPDEGEVVATGTYEYKGNTVNVSMNVPLGGGSITGFVSGTCDGRVAGSVSGQSVSGTMSGACSPFFVNIPASATYSGSLNKASKTISITFNGSGAGFHHGGSMVLSYQ